MGFRNGYQGSSGSNPARESFIKKLQEHNEKIKEFNRKSDSAVRDAVMQIAVVLAVAGIYVLHAYFDHQKQVKASPEGVTQEVQDATSVVFSAVYDNNVQAFEKAISSQYFDASCLNLKGENILDVAVRKYHVGSMRKSIVEDIINNVEIMKNINPRNRNIYNLTPVEQLESYINDAESGKTQAKPTAKDYALLKILKEIEKNSQSKEISFFKATAMYKDKSR